MIETTKQETIGQIAVDGGKVISQAELLEILFEDEKRGSTFVELEAETEPSKVRKTNNPYYGKVLKQARINGQLNWDYENAVNNQREREGNPDDFQQKKRTWGEHAINPVTGKVSRTIIEHKGNYYVQVRPLNVREVGFIWSESRKSLMNHEIAELKTFIPEHKPSETQETEKEIRVSDYMLSNIRTIKMFGQVYIIRG